MTTISIITAVLDSVNTIDDCLSSIHDQTNPPFEHIIVDGGSTDGTLEVIKQRKNDYTKLISEPDEGIYYGMNKGLALASGDIIGTLNADDFYAHPHVLERVLKRMDRTGADTCYGDLVYIAPETDNEISAKSNVFKRQDRIVRYWKSGNYNIQKFLWGWMVPHPTFFVRRKIYKKYGGFNTQLGTAADYELMLRLLVRYEISACYIPEVLIKMRSGGASNRTVKNRLLANKMDKQAWRLNGLNPYPWTIWLKPFRKINQWFLKEY